MSAQGSGEPYSIKAMIGFGGDIIMSSAPSRLAKEAVSKLDFHSRQTSL